MSSNAFAGWTYTLPVTEVFIDYSAAEPKLKIKQTNMWSPKVDGCPSNNTDVQYYVVEGDIKQIDRIYSAALTSLTSQASVKFGTSSCDENGYPIIWGVKLYSN